MRIKLVRFSRHSPTDLHESSPMNLRRIVRCVLTIVMISVTVFVVVFNPLEMGAVAIAGYLIWRVVKFGLLAWATKLLPARSQVLPAMAG